MLAVNRDIMIRTAALITAFLFFTAQGARSGDLILAANAVLNNFLLISAFFLDGLANAAEQLCGRAYGGRDRISFSAAVRLVIAWGFGVALTVAAGFALLGPALIDAMTASAASGNTRGIICGSWCCRRCPACSPSPMTGSSSARPGRARCAT